MARTGGHPRQKARAARVDGCDQCGQAHRQANGDPACIAHKAGKPDEPCKRAPNEGARVCSTHGGKAVQVKRKAGERFALMQAEGEIAQMMRECDVEGLHPIDGLLEVVRVSGTMMRLLTIRVGELKADPSIHTLAVPGKTPGQEASIVKVAGEDGFWGVSHTGDQVQHVYVRMLREWTERFEKACKTALDAGIEERRIRLAEDTTDTFFSALIKAIATAGLDPSMQAALKQALADELRKGQPTVIEHEAS